MNSIQFRAEDNWTVAELETFLHQLNILYSRLYIIKQARARDGLKLSGLLVRSVSIVRDENQLMIDRIEMHSPALIDFKGADKVIKELRLLLRDSRAHDERIIAIMKENGFPQEEINEFIRNDIQKLNRPTKKLWKLMVEKGISFLDSD